MFDALPIGTYYPGNSLLHRLQSRTKLLVIFWLAIFFILANHHFWHFAPYILAAGLLVVSIALSRISPRFLWRRMWLLIVLVIIGVIPTIFFPTDQGGKVLTTLGPFPVSLNVLRLSIVVYSALLLCLLFSLHLPFQSIQTLRRKSWFRILRFMLILLEIVALIFLWVTRRQPLHSNLPLGPLVITYDGVWIEITLFVVFLILYTFSLLLTLTTSPIALIEGLTILLTPLRKLRLPVDDFALMLLIALRFIPTLLEEVELLLKAQMARGASFTHGSLRERLQSLTSLFLPFIEGTLRRAADLATALEARGYEVEEHKTFLHETGFGIADYTVMIAVAIITLVTLFI